MRISSIICMSFLFFSSISLIYSEESPASAGQTSVDQNLSIPQGRDNAVITVDSPAPSDQSFYTFSSNNFVSAFISSLSMILVSEIGDKTFFIAAILAMKKSRLEIFAAAIAALALMTMLSALMGFTLPNILPPSLTKAAATILFFFFGGKLLYDAYNMEANETNEELGEVEEELERGELDTGTTLIEQGGVITETKPSASTVNFFRRLSRRVWFFFRRFVSPAFIQCFTMTFLAEWGDRSQIATIALAAAKDPFGVTVGGILGHSICTGLAVIGGRLLATKISEKTVSYVGGVVFLIFAFHSLYFRE
jgi:putative Ca2+/H+ antiporter (TMEM165/GDT1 family)